MDLTVRRAVVVDGNIFDKKHHPDLPEVDSVSRLLEKERERLGERNIPRFSTVLIEACIRTNDPVLWSAARDDVITNDFDVHAANVVLQTNDILPTLFVSCITTPKSVEHLLDMLFVLFKMIPELEDSTKCALSKAISAQWKPFTNVLLQTVETSSDRKFREGLYTALAQFVDVIYLQKEAIVATMNEILTHRKFELLSVFSRMDSNIFADMLPKLLAAAKASSATNRYAPIGLIAKILSETNIRSNDILPVTKLLLDRTVQDKFVDKRTLKSLAFILQKTADDPILKNFAMVVAWNLNM